MNPVLAPKRPECLAEVLLCHLCRWVYARVRSQSRLCHSRSHSYAAFAAFVLFMGCHPRCSPNAVTLILGFNVWPSVNPDSKPDV